jgi:hypothetical protein
MSEGGTEKREDVRKSNGDDELAQGQYDGDWGN